MEIFNLLAIVGRSIAVYLFILIALRITGKKELSQLTTSDIVLILLISNAVQNAMVGPDTSLIGGLCAAAVLFLVNIFLKKLLYKSKGFRTFMDQKPEVLIHNGKLDFKTLAHLEITNDELHEAMREHGVEHYKDVKWAILEMDGNISIISGNEALKQTQYKRKHQHKDLTVNN